MMKPRWSARIPVQGALLLGMMSLGAAPPSPEPPGDPAPQVQLAEPQPDPAALADAYREDLMDPDCPMFLGLEDAQILADALDIGTQVFRARPDLARPGQALPIEVCQVINPALVGVACRGALLFEARHFKVLVPSEPAASEYWHETQDAGYRTAAWIPMDGHCLIASLYYLSKGRLPEPQEVADARSVLAASLTDGQVQEAIQEARIDLLQNAPARPFANGRFSGWGPRVSQWLASDPALVAARQEADQAEAAMVERAILEQEAQEAKREEQHALDAVMALSLAGPQELGTTADPESCEAPGHS